MDGMLKYKTGNCLWSVAMMEKLQDVLRYYRQQVGFFQCIMQGIQKARLRIIVEKTIILVNQVRINRGIPGHQGDRPTRHALVMAETVESDSLRGQANARSCHVSPVLLGRQQGFWNDDVVLGMQAGKFAKPLNGAFPLWGI